MQDTRLILITGKKRSGKDYIASKLKDSIPNSEIIHFADALKDIVACTLGISREALEYGKNTNKNSKVIIETEDGTKVTRNFRQILQIFGTDAVKPVFGNEVWADIVVGKVINSSCSTVIIPDWRFISELDALWRTFKTTTLRVVDHNIVSTDTHPSETELDNMPTVFTVDNTAKKEFSISDIDGLKEYICYKRK